MNRRTFIVTSLAGPVLATACGRDRTDRVGMANRSVGTSDTFELHEMSLEALQDAMKSGRLSSRSVTALYLRRIGEIDRTGPGLRSIIETNPDALKIAEQLDAERKAGGQRSILHGIPVLLKDNIGTHDRMTTTGGSFALEGSIPPEDSFVARRLREAGVVFLGKANLAEWANSRSNFSVNGWSARGGQCRNPYVLDRTPIGSSSGCAAATTANMCAVAIGTETNGSITAPASACGLVGVKPTVGLVSRAGIIPASHSQDTPGPMCRSVWDAAALLGVMTGVDPRDPVTATSKGHVFTDYTQFLDRRGLMNARLGVARKLFGFHPAVDRLMDDALETMRQEGAELIELSEAFDLTGLGAREAEVGLYELKADLNAYFATLTEPFRGLTLEKLIAFNEKHSDRELQLFGQDAFIAAQAKGPLTEETYRRALRDNHQATRANGIDAVVQKHRLDAIICPTKGPAGVIDQVNGDKYLGRSHAVPAIAGYPHITVPAGFVRELPVGVSFFGSVWTEPVLFRLAYAFEQATAARRPPKFLPTLALL